jgi:hypothetical protein
MNDDTGAKAARTGNWFARAVLSSEFVVALVLALLCFLVLYFMKPDWAMAFVGWWLTGIVLHSMVIGAAEIDVPAWLNAPAFSLVLMGLFVVMGLFFPGLLAIFGWIAIAILVFAILMTVLREM